MRVKELHLHPRFKFADKADEARFIFRSLWQALRAQAQYRSGYFPEVKEGPVLWDALWDALDPFGRP